eukprot:7813890-Pyramimonas_sp.AAC.1
MAQGEPRETKGPLESSSRQRPCRSLEPASKRQGFGLPGFSEAIRWHPATAANFRRCYVFVYLPPASASYSSE